MKDLIEALNIFLKYGDHRNPTICVHDELIIAGIDPDDVSDEDKARLEELDFMVDEMEECFRSYRFGSA